MTNRILILLMLLISAGVTSAQNKKAVADSTVKKEVATDSVKIAADASKREAERADSLRRVKAYDSLTTELAQYKKFYMYINTKFFPERFRNIDVERAIVLGDSLSAANNSKWNGLQSLSKSKIDSLSLLLKEADTLRIQNQTFKALLISLIGENVYPLNEMELKGSWQVFVQPLKVTGSGVESAAVSLDRLILPDSLYRSSIKQIVFLDEDLADIYFFGGKKTKCFYKVTGFSREKTYFITLQKGEEINIKLFVTPVPRGLQVSYKLGKSPGQFMFGYMRK